MPSSRTSTTPTGTVRSRPVAARGRCDHSASTSPGSSSRAGTGPAPAGRPRCARRTRRRSTTPRPRRRGASARACRRPEPPGPGRRPRSTAWSASLAMAASARAERAGTAIPAPTDGRAFPQHDVRREVACLPALAEGRCVGRDVQEGLRQLRALDLVPGHDRRIARAAAPAVRAAARVSARTRMRECRRTPPAPRKVLSCPRETSRPGRWRSPAPCRGAPSSCWAGPARASPHLCPGHRDVRALRRPHGGRQPRARCRDGPGRRPRAGRARARRGTGSGSRAARSRWSPCRSP